MRLRLPFFFSLVFAAVVADAKPELSPLMAVPDRAVLDQDFSKSEPLKKDEWQSRQGTRWSIEDGLLVGLPSTPEFQASKPNHKGFEPRVSVPRTPMQFVARFSVRFLEGEETSVVPFVEFGHHVCRLKFSAEDGLFLLADGESVKLAEAKDFSYEPGRWYRALAEMKGEEFVVQFAGGPTLYARHECFAKPNPSGGNGLGIAGPKLGKVEIDDVAIWTIREETQDGWDKRREAFPKFEPVPTGKGKKKK